MASKYDSIRNRNKEGSDAKERVLSRTYGGGTQQQTQAPTSRFDAIRNRSTNLSVGDTARTSTTNTARQNTNEVRLGGSAPTVTRPSESASARSMHEQRLEQSEPVASTQPSFLQPQAKLGSFEAIRQFRKANPVVEQPGINERLGEKLREVPVVGSILRGLDKVQEFTEPAANIAQEYYTPGAGLTALAAAERGAVNLAGKLLPKAAPLVQRVAAESAVGGLTGAGQSLAAHPEEGFKGAAISGGIGAAGGAALPVIGAGIKRGVQAIKNAQPEQGTWFTRLFGDQNIGITPAASKKSNKIVTTEQQIVSNPLKEHIQDVGGRVKQGSRSLYQNNVDYLQPLKNISREAYDTALDASRANNVANTIVRDKFVDLQGNVIGNSLNDVLSESRGLGKKVDDYLVLRHAITRLERGERVYDEALGITPDKARELVSTLESRYPQLKEIGQQWDEYTTNLLDSGVNEGLITQEARDAMRASNPNYASMRRQFTTSEKYAQPKWGSGGSGFSGQNAPIKKVSPTGSTRQIVSPIRSAIEQTYAWKNAELRNRTMQQIVKTVQDNPEGMKGIVEIVKKPSTSFKSLDDALREGGSEEFIEQLDNDFKSLFQKAKPGEENIVRALVNGKPVYVRVHDPEAVKALLGMGNDQAGWALDILTKLSNATKRGATGVFAPFFSVKNLSSDTIQAAIQSPNAIKHIFIDVPAATISSLADVLKIPGLRNLAQEFERSGGKYSSLLRGDKPLNRAVYNLRREAPLSPGGVKKGAIAAVKAPFQALEKVADITENLNRVAAYRRSLIGKERTPETVRNAINAARESTTNFSRRGASSRQTEALVPYSNAAVQGGYRLAKAFVKNPVKTVGGIATLIIAPKLYEYAKFNDDPDYQRLPARERYRNTFISKNADGTFNKVPLPPEYSAFGAFYTDVLNDIVKKDPQAYKGSLDALANAFLPPIASGALQGATQGGGAEQSLTGLFNATTISPAVAVTANKSFTGAPIVPKRLEGQSTQYQYDERTSNVAKWVGKTIGLAPLKVDYLLRAYGGDPARLLLPLNSPIGAGTPRNTLLRNFITDPVFVNTLSDDYFTAKDAYAKADNDSKNFGAPFPKWYDPSIAKMLGSQAKGSANKKLSELNEEKRSVTGDKSLSAQDKADKLRDIQSKINQIYVDVNSSLKGFPFPNR